MLSCSSSTWLSGKEADCQCKRYEFYLGWDDPLEKKMATQSSILPGEFPRTEEPGRLQGFLQLQGVANRVRYDLETKIPTDVHSFQL